MNQGLIVGILSVLFYLSSLLGGGSQTPTTPTPNQESFFYLGQNGRVLGEKVMLRAQPANGSDPVGTVEQGQEITIIEVEGNWYKIRHSTGLDGWLPAYLVQLNPQDMTAGRPRNRVILAYLGQEEGGQEGLYEHSSQLTAIAPWGWELDSYGSLLESFSPADMGQNLYFAGNQELKTYALIQINAEPERLLSQSYLQERATQTILETVQEWGLKGVHFDLNYLPSQKLASFLARLKDKLAGENLEITLAVPLEASFNYEALAQQSHYLILKAFQITENPAPLAPHSWVEESLQEILGQVPASKVILGIATQGYRWPRWGAAHPLAYHEVMEIAASAGVSIKWDGAAQSPYFQDSSGQQVWFENRYSLKYKTDLVPKYDLAGLALLRLGAEDPEIWEAIAKLD